MKLDNEKNIKICQKAIYSKELYYYSKLCETYQKLAEQAILRNPNISAQDISTYYSIYLTKASRGILNFLNEPNDLTSAEKDLLTRYAKNSSFFLAFNRASHLLDSSLSKEGISQEKLRDYHNFMKNSKVTKEFDENIAKRHSTINSYNAAHLTSYAIDRINRIDSNHMNGFEKVLEYDLYPKNFGTNLTLNKHIENRINNFKARKRNFKKSCKKSWLCHFINCCFNICS